MRRKNIWLFILVDTFVIILSLIGAYLLRFDFLIPKEFISNAYYFLIVLLFSKLSVNVVFNVYSGLWRYTSVPDLINIIKASSAGTVLSAALTLMVLGFFAIPRSIFFIDYILSTIGFISARAAVRIYSNYFVKKQKLNYLPSIQGFCLTLKAKEMETKKLEIMILDGKQKYLSRIIKNHGII